MAKGHSLDRLVSDYFMNTRYKEGKIEFDLHDLFQDVSAETKMELVESLACDDQIIKHVSDQIITRWTENCCSGGSLCTASAEPRFGLDWAWREVAKRSGEVAEREIKRLEDAIKYKDERYAEALEENRRIRDELRIYR
jgi:hypothetical protein